MCQILGVGFTCENSNHWDHSLRDAAASSKCSYQTNPSCCFLRMPHSYYGTRGGSLRRDVRSKDQAGTIKQQQQWQKGALQEEQQRGKLPAHVVSKALQNPSVQNLARCLAYHRACLLELPLEQAAAAELVQLITDMGSALLIHLN